MADSFPTGARVFSRNGTIIADYPTARNTVPLPSTAGQPVAFMLVDATGTPIAYFNSELIAGVVRLA